MGDANDGDTSMEIFLSLMVVIMLLVLIGGLYLLKDRHVMMHSEPLSHTFLARILLNDNDAMTRLDLERNEEGEERWKCSVCEFTNSVDKVHCILCGTKQPTKSHASVLTTTSTSNHSVNTASTGCRNSLHTLDECRVKHRQEPTQRLSRSFSQSLQSTPSLSALNPRQRYARKRKEWVRTITGEGSAYWVRQDPSLHSTLSTSGRVLSLHVPGTNNSLMGRSRSQRRSSCVPLSRLSTGFVTYFVRSSDHSEGRLTFAETTRTDAGTTITGYKLEADELQMIDHVSQLPFPQKYTWFLERTSRLLRKWEDGRIKISVHRENILVESMEQLLGIQLEHVHYPLRIEFIGEQGIDAGGLQREWFSILFSNLLDDSLGLFMNCHRNNQSVAINPNSIECTTDHLLYFRGIGRLMGRALLEGQTMQARLCLPILKHFLGVPITFSDLQYVDPEVYTGMQWIREHDGVDQLDLTFSVTEIREDRPFVIDLVPGGREIGVTDDNKREYLHLKLRYLMLDRYAEQLQALSVGLFEVIPQENLMVFDYQELELVLCGLPEIDMADWRRNTTVASTFGDSPVPGWFWEVLGQLSEEERARFLQFSTGSARVPVQGFKGLTSYDGRICPFALRPLLNQTTGFPKVHTCFNRVEIPLYNSKAELEGAMYAILEMELNEFSEE